MRAVLEPDMTDGANAPAQLPATGTFVRKMVLGLIGVIVLVAVLGVTLREPMQAAGELFVGRFGVTGLFVAVFLVDSFPFTPHDPLLFAGMTGGISYRELLFVGITASILGGCVNWILGRLLGERVAVLRRIADRRGLPQLLERYGWWAMPIVGLLPLPFGLIAWAYAISGGPFAPLFLGTLTRGIKVVVAVTLMVAGWQIGA